MEGKKGSARPHQFSRISERGVVALVVEQRVLDGGDDGVTAVPNLERPAICHESALSGRRDGNWETHSRSRVLSTVVPLALVTGPGAFPPKLAPSQYCEAECRRPPRAPFMRSSRSPHGTVCNAGEAVDVCEQPRRQRDSADTFMYTMFQLYIVGLAAVCSPE